MAKKKRFYVVWSGRNPGVYDDWDDAREQIENFPGAKYKGFDSPAAAAEAFRAGMKESGELGALLLGARADRKAKSPGRSWQQFPEIDRTAWAVDASCMGNPGRMEYQGVDLATGKTIFRIGPFDDATNNIGEFLAIVHAMALMEKRGEQHLLYSDSRTAIGWVSRRHVRTTLKQTPRNGEVFDLLTRALKWLLTHTFRTRIVKWDTENWGEIPADFGRK